jgi:hypothetical protein
MDNQSPVPSRNEAFSTQQMLNYLAICLMMVCFSIVAVNATNAAFPTWNGTFLVILTGLIAAESLASNQVIKNSNLLKSNPLVSRISEWIVLLLVIKLSMYLASNPAQLLIDISLWAKDFGLFFLRDSYFAVCIFLFFLWLLTLTFANYLGKLEEDKGLLDLERQGDIRSTRPEARRGILTLVFGMGLAMVFLTLLSDLNLSIIPLKSGQVKEDVILILLFFFLGMVILAQTQNSILRAHWYIENIAVNPQITPRWILYSILTGVLIVLMTILLSLITNNYSQGIIDLVKSGVNLVVGIFSFFMVVILAPLLSLFWLLLRLLGFTGPTPSAPTTALATPNPTAVPPIPPPPASSSLAEMIKTIIFWGIFLFVIFYAFRQYLSQRQELLIGLRRIPLWSWIRRVFKWLSASFLQVNRQFSAILDAGVARFQALIQPKPGRVDPLLTISSLLPPRQRILLIYLSMIRWNNQNGFPRKGNQTPFEYARALDTTIPESRNDLDFITHTFIEARYTRHTLTLDQADQVQTALGHVQFIFSAYLKQQLQNQAEK